MEEMIEARVSPEEVWQAWEKAHELHGQKSIEEGQKGKSKFKYKVLHVKKGESFSILWKTLFVRLLFTHRVKPTQRGSEICYSVAIKGPFAWPIRWLLGDKIRKNIGAVLKAVVSELENKRVK